MFEAILDAAEAVALGRRGDGAAAVIMRSALRDLELNPMVYAQVARLVAPCAVAEGWGEPRQWLDTALATFEARGVPGPARACREAIWQGERVRRRDPAGLTSRERVVLDLVAQGLPNRAIAEQLFLSPRTVEKHVEHLLAKTGSTNRAQLATYALLRDACKGPAVK
jgi:DNA-binding CsgD family transcriptional regulator